MITVGVTNRFSLRHAVAGGLEKANDERSIDQPATSSFDYPAGGSLLRTQTGSLIKEQLLCGYSRTKLVLTDHMERYKPRWDGSQGHAACLWIELDKTFNPLVKPSTFRIIRTLLAA